MDHIIASLFVFIFIYLLYVITVLKNKKKMKEFENSGQGSFIIKKYDLDISKLNKKTFARSIALTNSFIITITFFITDFISHYIIKFLVGFAILVPFILIGYHIIGKIYKKKEVKNNV